MPSAFFEIDAAGTPVGSSFVFMTARDWARFGELFRNDGVTAGGRVLPEGWVRYSTTPTAKAPRGEYGAHWWLNAGRPGDGSDRPWPALPADAYAARGYAGQWVLVVPSHELVIVRLGMSFPDDGDDGTEALARAILEALR
jgi:CubicO group peptidase (beta-lactamase class C family)